jgi:hypothetical protein
MSIDTSKVRVFHQGPAYLVALVVWPFVAVLGLWTIEDRTFGVVQAVFFLSSAAWVGLKMPWRVEVSESHLNLTYIFRPLSKLVLSDSDCYFTARIRTRHSRLMLTTNFVKGHAERPILRIGPWAIRNAYLAGAPLQGFDWNSAPLAEELVARGYEVLIVK